MVGGGGRNPDGGEDVLRPERGLEQVAEEIVGLDGAAPMRARDLHLAAERKQAGRQFRGRVGKRDRPSERAAVADRRMADMRHRARDQRRVLRDVLRAFGRGVAHQGADLDRAIPTRNRVEAGNPVDVHEQARRIEPHVERGDQALASRQHPRPVTAREQLDSMAECAGLRIGERRRFHRILPSQAAFAVLVAPSSAGGRSKRRGLTRASIKTVQMMDCRLEAGNDDANHSAATAAAAARSSTKS